MSYGHAQSIMADGRKDKHVELRAAIAELRRWADLNPGLVPLYRDFQACLTQLDNPGKCIHKCADCTHHRGAHFNSGCDADLKGGCPCLQYKGPSTLCRCLS
jgi:hypothetical protein